LQLFLRSLRSAFSAADGGASVSAGLEAVSTGLEPFAGLEVGQFAAFLRQAQQSRDAGHVSVPSPASISAAPAETALRSAAALGDKLSSTGTLDTHHLTAEWERIRDELKHTLTAFLKPLAINVTIKGTQRQFHSILTNIQKSARPRTLAAQIRRALEGVTDEASLNTSERQQKLASITDGLKPAELQAVAHELGAPATSRSRPVLLAGIVERLTGFKPAAKRAAPTARQPVIDQAAVQHQAVKLKGLQEKSLNPGGLSNAELDAALAELEPMSAAELQAVAKEIGLDEVGAKKPAILDKIREKLQEAERARDSIQV
jgi:hypothetical protein